MGGDELGIGVIGLGFMGQTHLKAYAEAAAAGLPCRVVSAADRDRARRSGEAQSHGNLAPGAEPERLDHRAIDLYTDADSVFSDERVGLVSICTPTDTHVALALAALRAGKHILLEKPVALTEQEVRTVADAADAAGRVCMPAMCMRFWPAWAWLREAIGDGRFGAVTAARFERLGSAPAWGTEFYTDESRSGGAVFDLHIHDSDFVVACFGLPDSVDSCGKRAHISTRYKYDGSPAVVEAEGGWLSSPDFPFRMRYTVEFDNAVADFELGREAELLVHGPDGSSSPDLPVGDGYDGEIRAVVGAILSGRDTDPSMRDAAAVTGVLEAEIQSLACGRPVPVR